MRQTDLPVPKEVQQSETQRLNQESGTCSPFFSDRRCLGALELVADAFGASGETDFLAQRPAMEVARRKLNVRSGIRCTGNGDLLLLWRSLNNTTPFVTNTLRS